MVDPLLFIMFFFYTFDDAERLRETPPTL